MRVLFIVGLSGILGLVLLFSLRSKKFLELMQKVSPVIVAPEVQTVSDGSRTNIMVRLDSSPVKVSSGSANHRDAYIQGDFIVWVEAPQDRSEKYVVRYHIPSAVVVRLTETGVSQNPKVSTEGHVVWQQWQNETWHIFYFDGHEVVQITSGKQPAINPDVYNSKVVFAQKSTTGEWHVYLHDVATQEREMVPNSEGEKYPIFSRGDVVFAEQRKY
ncbi:hypothetical protein KBC79_03100 [Candidatus Woesebacteria bacterium]|nr:hypothetical protein [Candidatus Woesebacteria bacterium]